MTEESLQFIAFNLHSEIETGGKVCVTSTINPRLSHSVINPDIVSLLGLNRCGRSFAVIGGKVVEVPLYKLRLSFGDRTYEVDAIAQEINGLFVGGADLISQATNNDPTYYYELFTGEIVRALKAAARTKKKAILIIGPYGENLSILESIADQVAQVGYIPMILSHYPDIPEQSLPEKMLFLGSVARFVICVDTSPSGHIMEIETCARAVFTTAILRTCNHASTWMQHDVTVSNAYMDSFSIVDDDIESAVRDALLWGEKTTKDRISRYSTEYPWRNSNVSI